ncbi:BURP domain-containing protein 6-like [Panicum virgatum]|uniref:BURP domain-containing protein n=1 Tax=Panicum virgatum TaxID=38727 RepID=A0A8T0WNH1_PANVG|nr:BURP domain-containing protein 6-like [Panicum virgatum]KAG2649580.1 hypothetical protein PVAP13_1NG140000 [Panicum virgatum]
MANLLTALLLLLVAAVIASGLYEDDPGGGGGGGRSSGGAKGAPAPPTGCSRSIKPKRPMGEEVWRGKDAREEEEEEEASPTYTLPLGSHLDTAFFLLNHLYPGSKMTLHFTRDAAAPMLPRAQADSIPFTSAKIREILSRLSVPAGSLAAEDIRSTLAECEAPPLSGVAAQRCATSFESMVDLAASCLGTRDIHLPAMSRLSLIKEGSSVPTQAYVVESIRLLLVAGGDIVACHRMPYPYAVFVCHMTKAAVYAVTLAGADRTKAEALTACHKDAWPQDKNIAVVPGALPVCHFLSQDSMLWVRK